MEIPPQYRGKKNPLTDNPEAVKAGEKIYKNYASACHTPQGIGPNFEEKETWDKEDDYLLWRISEGVPGTAMPPWKSTLTEEQIWQVIAYGRHLAEKKQK